MSVIKEEVEEYIISEKAKGKFHTYYDLEWLFLKEERKARRYDFLHILIELKEEGKLSEPVLENMLLPGEYPIEANILKKILEIKPDEECRMSSAKETLPMTSISLEISNPCNERCVHCYRTCEGTKCGFLTERQARSVLEQAKELGAVSATVTGGEALLNPEWRGILGAADGLGFRTSLFTNGTLMKAEDADFLAGMMHLKEAQLSLYALDDAAHDAITGLEGSCAATKNALSMLRERGVPVFVSCPVMKENKTAVLDLMRWCDDNGIPNCADIFIFGDSDYTGKNLAHRLSREDIEGFFEETMKDDGRLSYVWGSGHGARDLSQVEFYGGAVCSLCVSGDGTIYPAIGWYEPLGNIAADTLRDVYEDSPLLRRLREIRAADIPECAVCRCADFCEFCFSPHVTANRGALGKVDAEFCAFVALRKKLAARRDEIMKANHWNKE